MHRRNHFIVKFKKQVVDDHNKQKITTSNSQDVHKIYVQEVVCTLHVYRGAGGDELDRTVRELSQKVALF